MAQTKIESGFNSDAKKEPRRIVFITRNTSAKVKDERGPKLMTYPALMVREAIVFEVLVVVMVLIALFWDAPLEQLANPLLTPNPAKAPWYFLGLQELLHFFPPFVAGILIPTLVVIALVVIPYFKINVEGISLCDENAGQRVGIVLGVVVGLLIVLAAFDAWTIIVPTFVVAALLVDYDLVHCHGDLSDSRRNFFPRAGMVLGLALGDPCQLKIWASCRTKYG